jgi:hypothetical protein
MEGLIPNSLIMSNFFYDPNQAWNPTYWNYTEPIQPNPRSSTQALYPSATTTSSEDFLLPQQLPYTPQYNYNAVQYAPQPGTVFQPPRWDPASWAQPGHTQAPQTQQAPLYNNYTAPAYPTHRPSISAPIPHYLSPSIPSQSETSRQNSAASNTGSIIDRTTSEVSRSVSPNPSAIADYGFKNPDNSWACAWPGCTSRSRFTRACDLRKHYKRHSKTLFCRHDGCPQATEGGFSSKKDRARHEAKHNPTITCEWDGCGRLFSRVDNMVRTLQCLNMGGLADFAGRHRKIT